MDNDRKNLYYMYFPSLSVVFFICFTVLLNEFLLPESIVYGDHEDDIAFLVIMTSLAMAGFFYGFLLFFYTLLIAFSKKTADRLAGKGGRLLSALAISFVLGFLIFTINPILNPNTAVSGLIGGAILCIAFFFLKRWHDYRSTKRSVKGGEG